MSSTSDTIDPPREFHVLIVGAGLGGLLMAILLDRAGISFELFEKAEKIKPLGNHELTFACHGQLAKACSLILISPLNFRRCFVACGQHPSCV